MFILLTSMTIEGCEVISRTDHNEVLDKESAELALE